MTDYTRLGRVLANALSDTDCQELGQFLTACLRSAGIDDHMTQLVILGQLDELRDQGRGLAPQVAGARAARWPAPTSRRPDMEDLLEWQQGGICEATDGCEVEPDGICQHGYPSWLLFYGMI